MLSFDIVDFVLDWQVVSWEKHYSPVGQFTAANNFSNPWISNVKRKAKKLHFEVARS